MVHLDTNFLIDALIPGSPQETQLAAWLAAGETLGISTLVWGEFLCGPLSPAAEVLVRRLFAHPVALERADAEHADGSTI
jgi:predicted nucleic acid-binding protein